MTEEEDEYISPLAAMAGTMLFTAGTTAIVVTIGSLIVKWMFGL